MPPNRVVKRHLTMAEISKSRALLRLKDKGLASDLINIDVIEAAVLSQESPDIEMIDNQIDLLIAQDLETSNWATKSHTELNQTTTRKEDAKVTVTSANPTNEHTPAIKPSIPTSSESVTKTVSSKPVANVIRPILPLKPKQNSGKKTEGISVSAPVNDLPLELRAVVEAEKQRAAKTAANIKTCAIAINGIQEALSNIDNGENKLFQDSLLVYLRAAIAQFMAIGPGALPANLPPRPLVSRHSGDIPPQPISGKSSWATITSIAHQKSQDTVNVNPGSSRTSGVTRTNTKALPTKVEERFFLRIPKDHKWRDLSPVGIHEAIVQHLECDSEDITNIHRVMSGFAMRAKDGETRQNLLDRSSVLIPFVRVT